MAGNNNGSMAGQSRVRVDLSQQAPELNATGDVMGMTGGLDEELKMTFPKPTLTSVEEPSVQAAAAQQV